MGGGGEIAAVECISLQSEVEGVITQPLQDLKEDAPSHAIPLPKVERQIDA